MSPGDEAPTRDDRQVVRRTAAVVEVLGGVLRGTVVQYTPNEGFFVGDAFWLPPDGDPIGPMALEVSVKAEGTATRLRVAQTGFEDGDRWRRYYELIGGGWNRALNSLKQLLEK